MLGRNLVFMNGESRPCLSWSLRWSTSSRNFLKYIGRRLRPWSWGHATGNITLILPIVLIFSVGY